MRLKKPTFVKCQDFSRMESSKPKTVYVFDFERTYVYFQLLPALIVSVFEDCIPL